MWGPLGPPMGAHAAAAVRAVGAGGRPGSGRAARAVGTAAEMARRAGVKPVDIDRNALQSRLVTDGAFIGDKKV